MSVKLQSLSRSESQAVVEVVLGCLRRSLHANDWVKLRVRLFHMRQRKARIGRNPNTGEHLLVPAQKVAFLKPSKELLRMINNNGLTETNS